MPAILRLCLISVVCLCLAAGCGSQTKGPVSPPTQVSSNAPQPTQLVAPSQQAPAVPATSQPTLTESGLAGVLSKKAAEDAPAREKAVPELAESEVKAAELAAQIAERKARLAKMEERWSTLTSEERQRLIKIKEALIAGKGITLGPSDFLFVYGSVNEIFVERELQAAAVVSCGPFIDYLGERLGWPPERRIVSLGVFARLYGTKRIRPVPDESAQGWYLQQVQILYKLYGHPGESTDGLSGNDDFIRLGVLAEVMHQRSRALTDSEIVFLRELVPAPTLQKYLQLGPDPVKIAANAAELAREREAGLAEAREAELAEARLQESAEAAERATATKEIAAIAKQLDPLYTRKARMRKVDTDDPRALQNLDNLNSEIAAAERQLRERLAILFPDGTDVLSKSGAEWDKILAKLFPADKKTQQFLKRYCER